MICDGEKENGGLWRDPLERIYYIFRPEDPAHYSHICPHCQRRYGDKENYITLRRCDLCPPFIVGLETSWNFTKSEYKHLRALGYFNEKAKGGKKGRTENEMDLITMAQKS